MIFHRWGPGSEGIDYFLIALNFSDAAQEVDIPVPRNGEWMDVLANTPRVVTADSFVLRACPVPSNYGCVFHHAE